MTHLVDGKAVHQRPAYYELIKFAVEKEAEINFDKAKKARGSTPKPKATMHFHFDNKKPMLPTTPAVRMVAPAPEEGSGEGEATPSPVKRVTVANPMRPHLKILPSLKETLRLLLEWHKHQRHLQVDVSGATRYPWCGSKPPILACDGTHISISIRNMKLERPVTDPDLPDTTYKAQHKQGDRVVIKDPSARRHLNYLSKKMLKKIKEKDIIDVDLERERTQDMLQKVYRENQFDADGNEIIPQQQELYEALLVFTGNLPMHKDVINVLARLFLMLSGDVAISSIVPFPCHYLLNVCCDDALNNTLNDCDVQNLKKYSIELAQLLVLCQKHNCTQFGVDFSRCLMRKIKDVHKHNRPAPEVEVIPSGCAYYFIDTGEQVYKMPIHFVSGDRKARNPNFDDMPDVDPSCSKLFSKISRSGFGYLFLWSAPCMAIATAFIS